MIKKVPAKTKDMPATHGMLLELRDELKSEIRASTKRLEATVEAGFKRADADIAELKSLFHQAMLRFEEQRLKIRLS